MTAGDDQAAPAPEKYNPMFETFVGRDLDKADDLTSLIAYALYKKAKVQWTLKIKKDKGRSPSPEEQTAYYETWTDTQISALRDRAENSLAAFAESVIEDAKPGILKEALSGKLTTDVGHAMLASFLYTLLLIGFALILKWSGVDLLELLKKANPQQSP